MAFHTDLNKKINECSGKKQSLRASDGQPCFGFSRCRAFYFGSLENPFPGSEVNQIEKDNPTFFCPK